MTESEFPRLTKSHFPGVATQRGAELLLASFPTFDRFQSEPEFRQLSVDVHQGVCLHYGNRIGRYIRPGYSHISSLAASSHDQASVLECSEGALDGGDGDAVLRRDVLVRRKFVAHLVRPSAQLCSEASCNLLIRGPGIIHVEFVHVGHLTRLGQLLHPGDERLQS